MIIVGMKGGLGNQMFEYALAYKIRKMGKEVYLDNYLFEHGIEKRPFELDLFPNIEYKISTEVLNEKLRGKYESLIQKSLRMLNIRPKYYREVFHGYKKKVLTWDNKYIDGYWQTEKYIQDIREDILNVFSFPELQGEKNIDIAKRIVEGNSVSIHVRRGDYMNNIARYGNLGEGQYYDDAIRYIESTVENPMFYVFSDDVEWAEKRFNKSNYTVVDNKNTGKFSYVDMQLMSCCKHNIIANSSFSWWAAWLNRNENKVVVAPSAWERNKKVKDIYCKEWKVI